MSTRAGASEFGRRLRAARAYGRPDGTEISQDALAEELGQSRNPVTAWESGEREPKRGQRRGIVATIEEMTGLPTEFFAVDFSELEGAITHYPQLLLDWEAREMGEGGGELDER